MVVTVPAYSQDFRSFNRGDDCSNLKQVEIKRGSKLIREATGLYFFDGEFLNRKVKIFYQCQNNNFYIGNYSFDLKNYKEAKALFFELKKEYIKIYGAPTGKYQRLYEFNKKYKVDVEIMKYSAEWEKDKLNVSLITYGPSKKREGYKISINYYYDK